MSTTTGPVLTVRNKIGLVLAVLLGLTDVLGPSPAGVAAQLLFPQATDTPGDPYSIDPRGPALVGVIVANVILCLATIVAVTVAWATGNRIARRVVAAARVVAALLAAPVFLVAGLPAWLSAIAAALVIANITAAILVLSGSAAAPRPAGAEVRH